MYQLTQLAAGQHRQRLAAAEQQRPAQRALALARATRRAERAERRMRRAARQTCHRSVITRRPPPATPSPSDHQEVTMTRIRRILTALATLAGALLAFTAAAPAALADHVP